MTDIERGIPVPPAYDSTKYFFGDMKVGDSFRLDSVNHGRVRAASSAYGKRYKKRFTVRKYEGAYRCWRTA